MKKLKFDPKEALAVVVKNIASLIVVSAGGTQEQAELTGSLLEGTVKGFHFEHSIVDKMKLTMESSVTTAIDSFELIDECRSELEKNLISIECLNEYLESDNQVALLKSRIVQICGQFEQCDISTLPVDELAESIISVLYYAITEDHEITSLINFQVTNKILLDNKEILLVVKELKEFLSNEVQPVVPLNYEKRHNVEYPIFITEKPFSTCIKYQRRSDLCEQLIDLLAKERLLNIYSIGGVGKTELIKELVEKIQSKKIQLTGISEIAWIQYVSNDFVCSLQNAFYRDFSWMDFQWLCETKREHLLIIVDDIEQVSDSYLTKLATLPCYIILTSRVRNIASFSLWELPYLTKEQQKNLFYSNYTGERKDGILDDVLKLTADHTITIDFISKLAEYQDWSLNELYDKLEQKGFRLSDTKLSSEHERLNDEETIIKQLSNLFEIIGYNEEDVMVLTYSSMIPNLSYTVEQAREWFQIDCVSILNKLYEIGMLESSRNNCIKTYWMHSIIASAIRYQQKESLYEKTRPFVLQMSEILETGSEWGYGYKKFYLIPFCWAIYDLLENNLADEDDATFIMRLCYIMLDASNNIMARDLAERACDIDCKYELWYSVFRDIRAIGDAETRLWNPDKALEQYEEALKILTQKVDNNEKDYYHDLSAVHHNIANAYQELSVYDKALDHAFESKKLQEKYDVTNKREISTCLSSIAMIYLDMGDLKNAYSFVEKAIKVQDEIDDTNSEDIMLLLYRANVLMEMESYDEALKDFETVKTFRETHYHEKHGDLADLYLDYSLCLCYSGDFEKAIAYIDKAIDIFLYNDGKNSVRYLRGKNTKALILTEFHKANAACDEYAQIFQINEISNILSDSDIVTFSTNYVDALIQISDFNKALKINNTANEIYTASKSIEHPTIKQNLMENFAEIYSGMEDIRAIEYYEQLHSVCYDKESSVQIKLSEAELYIRLNLYDEANSILVDLIDMLENDKELMYYYICCLGYMSSMSRIFKRIRLQIKIRLLLRKIPTDLKMIVREQFL